MTNAAPAPLKATHHLILVLLAEESTYGVALMERLEHRSRGAIRLNAGSLYRTIASLVDDGLVEPIEDEARPDGAGAPRKVYGVTRRGLDALRAEARRQSDLLDAVRALDLLAEMVEKARSAGETGAAVDSRIAAYAFFGAIEAVITGLVFKSIEDDDETIEGIKRSLTDLFLRGVAAPPGTVGP